MASMKTVTIRGKPHKASIVEPDGTVSVVTSVDMMLSAMMRISGKYSNCKMNDKRNWKFPGEA